MIFLNGLLMCRCGKNVEGKKLMAKGAEMKEKMISPNGKAMDYANAAYFYAYTGNREKSISLVDAALDKCKSQDPKCKFELAMLLDMKDWFCNFNVDQELRDFGNNTPSKYSSHVESIR